jgi:hypothetical protein
MPTLSAVAVSLVFKSALGLKRLTDSSSEAAEVNAVADRNASSVRIAKCDGA